MRTRPDAPVPVVLALGSNLGDRDANMVAAMRMLMELDGLQVVSRSQLVETDPVGGPEQGAYLNAVVLGETTLSPFDLLDACQGVESALARTREIRWGPRTIDIDIIKYGERIDDDERLTLPHPRAHERAFVLVPWAQADPEATLPGPDGGPVAVLASRAPDRLGVRRHVRRKTLP